MLSFNPAFRPRLEDLKIKFQDANKFLSESEEYAFRSFRSWPDIARLCPQTACANNKPTQSLFEEVLLELSKSRTSGLDKCKELFEVNDGCAYFELGEHRFKKKNLVSVAEVLSQQMKSNCALKAAKYYIAVGIRNEREKKNFDVIINKLMCLKQNTGRAYFVLHGLILSDASYVDCKDTDYFVASASLKPLITPNVCCLIYEKVN